MPQAARAFRCSGSSSAVTNAVTSTSFTTKLPTSPDTLTSVSHESAILTCRRSQSRNFAPVKSAPVKLAPRNAAVWSYSVAIAPLFPIGRGHGRIDAALVPGPAGQQPGLALRRQPYAVGDGRGGVQPGFADLADA